MNNSSRRRSKECATGLVLAVVLLVSPLAGAADLSLTLEDAIRRGFDANERYRMALAEKQRAREQTKDARAGALPAVNFHANFEHAFEIPEIVIGGQSIPLGTPYSSSWGFSVEQSLWQGGRVFEAIKAANNFREYAGASVAQATLDVQTEITRAFLSAILARRLVGVAQKTLDVAAENFAVVDKKFAQGLVSEYDHLRARVRVSNLRPALIQAKNNRQLAESRLRTLIGIEAGLSLELTESEPDSSAWENEELSALVARAIKTRPDLIAADYEVRMRKNAVRIVKAGYWPSFKLLGQFDWQTFSDDFAFRREERTRSWRGMLTISYSLFDGFRRSGQVGVARVDLTQAELRRMEMRKNSALEIERARNNFVEANDRLDALRETVGQAERGVALAGIRYESGVGTQLEVLDAQLELATARIHAETARYDRLIARAEWRRAMGEPVLDVLEQE